MIIYLDILYTLFEMNERCNFGWVEVIDKLQKSGKHKIILNSSFTGAILRKYLKNINEDSWMFSENREIEIQPITDIVEEKIHPSRWNWKEMIENQEMFIDDYAREIPLKSGFDRGEKIVDWKQIDKEFEENNMY